MDEEDKLSPREFYYPEDLKSLDVETETGITECHIINNLLTELARAILGNIGPRFARSILPRPRVSKRLLFVLYSHQAVWQVCQVHSPCYQTPWTQHDNQELTKVTYRFAKFTWCPSSENCFHVAIVDFWWILFLMVKLTEQPWNWMSRPNWKEKLSISVPCLTSSQELRCFKNIPKSKKRKDISPNIDMPLLILVWLVVSVWRLLN